MNRENLAILLTLLVFRTSFIFGDAILSNKQIKEKIIAPVEQKQEIVQKELNENHSSASQTPTKNIPIQNISDNYQKIQLENQENGLENKNLNIKEISSNTSDTEMLEKLYEKTKSEDVLKLLLNKLLWEYQFESAKKYIGDIDVLKNNIVDSNSYFYMQINNLSITDPNSMHKFMALVDQMKYRSFVSSDDYSFYQWLSKVWVKDYTNAETLFQQIQSPLYSNLISQFNDSIQKFNNQKWVPDYYQDSLIALVFMKNGYFSIANKLAVDSILQNKEYILPYQILAYSNFLTNNWSKSAENFYELISLDLENKDKYTFYIWVSQYRLWENTKSVLTLSQLTSNSQYKTDAYRYLLLNYQKLKDESRMIQVWQKLLGQDDLTESDFKTFYDIVFYKDFANNTKHTLYRQYKQMSYDYVFICYDRFWQENDTCLYGEIGLDIANENWSDLENNLIYLSNKYPQSHIFQALWDYYKKQKQTEKAKTYYLKAISLTDDLSQKNLIEQNLVDF